MRRGLAVLLLCACGGADPDDPRVDAAPHDAAADAARGRIDAHADAPVPDAGGEAVDLGPDAPPPDLGPELGPDGPVLPGPGEDCATAFACQAGLDCWLLAALGQAICTRDCVSDAGCTGEFGPSCCARPGKQTQLVVCIPESFGLCE